MKHGPWRKRWEPGTWPKPCECNGWPMRTPAWKRRGVSCDGLARDRLKEISTTLLTQQGPRPRLKANHAGAVLDMLEACGYLMANKPDGRRKPVYRVNPAYLATLANLAGVTMKSENEKSGGGLANLANLANYTLERAKQATSRHDEP